MEDRLLISADEINCLIYSYFRDSGFQHAAFTLRSEAQLELSPYFKQHIPRGELVELLSKALLFTEAEKHWKGNFACKSGFSLLTPHVCNPELPKQVTKRTDLSVTEQQRPEPRRPNGIHDDAATKRKATPPLSTETRAEKRARTEQNPTVSTVPELSESNVANQGTPNPVDPPPDPPTEKPPPSVSADHDANPPAVHLLNGHTSEVFICAWNPVNLEQLASGSQDATVNIWTVPVSGVDRVAPPGTGVISLREHFAPPCVQGDLTSLDWNVDGSLIAIGSYDSVLRVCHASGELFLKDETHKGPIFAAKFSKTGRLLLTASLDATVCVWNVWEKKLHKQYRYHSDCCLDVDWLDENTFASCGADNVIHIVRIDDDDRGPLRTLSGHTDEINQIKSNVSKMRLASCSDDQTARIWNIADVAGHSVDASYDSSRVTVLQGHSHCVSGVEWCTHQTWNEIVATSSFDHTARLWDATSGACLKIFNDHQRPVYALSFSPDGNWLATGSGDGFLHVYHVKTRKKSWSWYAGPEKPSVFAIDWQMTKKTNRIALALESRRVGIIDMTKIPALREIP